MKFLNAFLHGILFLFIIFIFILVLSRIFIDLDHGLIRIKKKQKKAI